jgi:predicted Zn-dependent protease
VKISPDALRALAKKALAASTAPQTEVWASATAESWVRFAADTVTTSGTVERVSLDVTAAFGQRTGNATTEDVTPEGLAHVVRQATDLAKLLPASPERLPPVPPQRYPVNAAAMDAATAAVGAAERSAVVGAVLGAGRNAGLVAAGYHETSERMTAFASSSGAAGLSRSTAAQLECTLRTPDGAQSGWAGAYSPKFASIDAAALAARAADKASRWKSPEALAPGRYTAILEPAAVEPLLGYLFWNLDRRAADEGRSAFSAPDGKTRIGEALFSERVSLFCDPADKAIPGSPFGEDGLAAKKFVAVDKGVLTGLRVSRHWAKQKKLEPTATSGNWILAVSGPDPKGVDGMIASTERGILVTRIWYVRMLSPQNLTVTGLTRDATVLVENGQVTRPIKNFRINQSVLELLKNVEGASTPQPFPAGGGWRGIPALKIRDLNFSSLSDAV